MLALNPHCENGVAKQRQTNDVDKGAKKKNGGASGAVVNHKGLPSANDVEERLLGEVGMAWDLRCRFNLIPVCVMPTQRGES